MEEFIINKIGVDSLLLFIITQEGFVYYELFQNDRMHRDALKSGYEYFLKNNISLLPMPFFKGNHTTCQMMSSSGALVFMNCFTQGVLYIPDYISNMQKQLLDDFDFTNLETICINSLLEEVNYVRGGL